MNQPLTLRILPLGSKLPLGATQWLANLEPYLKRRNEEATEQSKPCNAGTDGVVDIVLRISEHSEASTRQRVLWTGDPFVLVGSKVEVSLYLQELTDANRRLLANHDYFWVLTEPDAVQDVEKMLRTSMVSTLWGDRTLAIEWLGANFNIVRRELLDLQHSPALVGLSRDLRLIRSQVRRIAHQPIGPWSPVLVFGEAGVGKTEVARALHQESGRSDALRVVQCGLSNEAILRDELFGHVEGAFNSATHAAPGLLETFSRGTLLLKDVEAAAPAVQGALLSMLSTPRGQAAAFSPLGATQQVRSDVWVVLASTSEVEHLFQEGGLRVDFLFRCEDRVIYVPPLRQRPADLPAIAKRIWAELALSNEQARELAPAAIEALHNPGAQWDGNVRALRTLLSLTFFWAHQPSAISSPIGNLIHSIYRLGPEYSHWVGVLKSITRPLETGDRRVNAILKLDSESNCGKSTEPWPAAGSEKRAAEILAARHENQVDSFRSLVMSYRRVRSEVRPSVRLSRLICFMEEHGDLSIALGGELCPVGERTVDADLKKLESCGLIERTSAKPTSFRLRLVDGGVTINHAPSAVPER